MGVNDSLKTKTTSDRENRKKFQNERNNQKEGGNMPFTEDNGYFMTVNIDIMQEAGINKGDTILVNKELKPLNGDVVVVNISGDVIIRFFQKVQSKIFLSADGGKVCPIQIEPGSEDFEIIGVVTYVVKRL
ncbi:MAG: S24 family peptidase [Ginsengibacter sp.]